MRAREVSPWNSPQGIPAEHTREQPRLNAFITITAETATSKQARRRLDDDFAKRDRPRPLQGSPKPERPVPHERDPNNGWDESLRPNLHSDCASTKASRPAGAVLMAKTGFHELSLRDTRTKQQYGAVRNLTIPPLFPGGSAVVEELPWPLKWFLSTRGPAIPEDRFASTAYCGCVGRTDIWPRQGVSLDATGPAA